MQTLTPSAAATALDPVETAHRNSVEENFPAVVQFLADTLGSKTLVAQIAGVGPHTIARWIAEERRPRIDSERRLRAAHLVLQELLRAANEQTARAWFNTMNPRLEDQTPVEALAKSPSAVLDAARYFTRPTLIKGGADA